MGKVLEAVIGRDEQSKLGAHWICRLYEPGGYVWHGQIVHTDFGDNTTKEEFIEKCKALFGEIEVTA